MIRLGGNGSKLCLGALDWTLGSTFVLKDGQILKRALESGVDVPSLSVFKEAFGQYPQQYVLSWSALNWSGIWTR